eukprot:10446770-Ditylum_brightwellii.AAC.1
MSGMLGPARVGASTLQDWWLKFGVVSYKLKECQVYWNWRHLVTSGREGNPLCLWAGGDGCLCGGSRVESTQWIEFGTSLEIRKEDDVVACPALLATRVLFCAQHTPPLEGFGLEGD